MRIYLTSFVYLGDEYAGPEIIADSWDMADEIAEPHGLIVIGELTDLIHEDIVKSERVIH